MPFKSVKDEMHKFSQGKLHSGSNKGPIVKNRKQAIAISLSEKKKSSNGGGGINVAPSSKFMERFKSISKKSK